MKNLIFFTAFFLIQISFTLKAQLPSTQFGQDNVNPSKEISEENLPSRGIYQSFTELRDNKPGMTDEFTIRTKNNSGLQVFEIRDKAKNKKIKRVYGFSDGQALYIHARNYTNGNYFTRLQNRGKYMYFEDWGGSGVGIGIGIGIGPVGVGTGGRQRLKAYFLDALSGQIETLNRNRLRLLLAQTPDLLQSYEKEKNRKDIATIKRYFFDFVQAIEKK